MLLKIHFLNCGIQNNLSVCRCHMHWFTGQAVEHKSTAELKFFVERKGDECISSVSYNTMSHRIDSIVSAGKGS